MVNLKRHNFFPPKITTNTNRHRHTKGHGYQKRWRKNPLWLDLWHLFTYYQPFPAFSLNTVHHTWRLGDWCTTPNRSRCHVNTYHPWPTYLYWQRLGDWCTTPSQFNQVIIINDHHTYMQNHSSNRPGWPKPNRPEPVT